MRGENTTSKSASKSELVCQKTLYGDTNTPIGICGKPADFMWMDKWPLCHIHALEKSSDVERIKVPNDVVENNRYSSDSR